MSPIKSITHSTSGASCEIYQWGATVTSFKVASGRECLFVSRDAKLDGSKAIRGGIPLVFPQFGQPDKSMPQHGFLRNNYWKFDESSAYDKTDSAGISLTLDLKDVKNSRGGKWDENTTTFDCSCVFSIEIDANKMTTVLEIQNTSSNSFEFQTLQHTYFLVDGGAALDSAQCYVKGLEGYSVVDKITNEEYVLGEDPVVISGNVDRIYTPPAGDKDVVDVDIGVGGGKVVKMTATGMMDGASTPTSCVVWNPYKEKAAAMGDFGDDQYVDMICVEPGLLEGLSLEGGKSAKLVQTIEMK